MVSYSGRPNEIQKGCLHSTATPPLSPAHHARAYSTEKSVWVADNGLQVLGGHGFIRDHPVEMWARNARGFAIFEGIAMNDVVVSRGSSGSMIEFAVHVDGEFIYSLRADGVIAASPTGTIASKGGSLMLIGPRTVGQFNSYRGFRAEDFSEAGEVRST